MYSASDLFNKAYAYCMRNYDQVVILSAKYGLLFPDDIIEPYDLTLNKMSVAEIEDWAETVFKQMQKRLNLSEIQAMFFHAGDKYRRRLLLKLQILSIECKAPLSGLDIGKQLKWYNTYRECARFHGENYTIISESTFGE
jgi:cytoplasmic iron level regulating protein YaaA (DUF328/UPF0246 family)